MAKADDDDITIFERILTRTEAAAACGISERTLIRLAVAGTGPPTKRLSKKRIGYPAAQLRKWLEERAG
jgi:predicted DNA-binding transcriptional regulator AlpA